MSATIATAAAASLGYAVLRKLMPHRHDAQAMRRVYDYRAVGLNVDQVRGKLDRAAGKLNFKSRRRWHWAHASKAARAERANETSGRILRLVKARRAARATLAKLTTLPTRISDHSLTWREPKLLLSISPDAVTVAEHHEHATWGDKSKYPSRETWYEIVRYSLPSRGDWQFGCDEPRREILHTFSGRLKGLRGACAKVGTKMPYRQKRRVAVVVYKAVAVADDGSLRSIFDGATEYRIGHTLRQRAKEEHGGGFYAYAMSNAAAVCEMPNTSALRDAPRRIIKCVAMGPSVEYDNGKIAFSALRPVEVIQ